MDVLNQIGIFKKSIKIDKFLSNESKKKAFAISDEIGFKVKSRLQGNIVNNKTNRYSNNIVNNILGPKSFKIELNQLQESIKKEKLIDNDITNWAINKLEKVRWLK